MKMRLGWTSSVVLPKSFCSHCLWPQHGLIWPFTLLWRTPSFSPPSEFLREGTMCSTFLNQDVYSCNAFSQHQLNAFLQYMLNIPKGYPWRDAIFLYISNSCPLCNPHSGYVPPPWSSPAKWTITSTASSQWEVGYHISSSQTCSWHTVKPSEYYWAFWW